MKNWRFPTNISLYFEKKVQDTAVIVTMEDESELLCDISNGVISNDLE